MNNIFRANAPRIGMLAAGIATVAIAGWLGIGSATRDAPDTHEPAFQCAHWCIRRCCELFGAPVELTEVAQMLPPDERGHSLQQVAKVLETIGFNTTARLESWEVFRKRRGPCIAHLGEPDHFVVVVGVEHGRVHLFDGAGQRTTRLAKSFRDKWTGHLLYVAPRAGESALPVYAPAPAKGSPRVRFDTLFIDRGEMPPPTAPLSFIYRFTNVGRGILRIKDIHKKCSCIQVRAPTEPIPPGKSAEINIAYSVQLQGGRSSRRRSSKRTIRPFQWSGSRRRATWIAASASFPRYWISVRS